MRRLLLLILTLTLIIGTFASCDIANSIDTGVFEESVSETTVETTVETSTEATTSNESSETKPGIIYGSERFEFDSYDELEMALSGEYQHGKEILDGMCDMYPAFKIILDYIKQEGNLKKPLVNGIPVAVNNAGFWVLGGTFDPLPLGPCLIYSQTDGNYEISGFQMHYLLLEDFYKTDYSSCKTAMDICKMENFDPCTRKEFDLAMWEEKELIIGGETVSVMECKTVDLPNERHLVYYKDGWFVSMWNTTGEFTDEFLKSFSVG